MRAASISVIIGERAKRARGRGRDGSDAIVRHSIPPTRINYSGPNFQGIIRTWERLHIYKISPIGQQIQKLHFMGMPVDAPLVHWYAPWPCRAGAVVVDKFKDVALLRVRPIHKVLELGNHPRMEFM